MYIALGKKRKVGTATYTNKQTSPGKNVAARLGGAVGIAGGAAAVSRKAVWYDLRLASLLTHLFQIV